MDEKVKKKKKKTLIWKSNIFIELHQVQFCSEIIFHCAIYTIVLILSNFAKIFKDLIYSISRSF